MTFKLHLTPTLVCLGKKFCLDPSLRWKLLPIGPKTHPKSRNTKKHRVYTSFSTSSRQCFAFFPVTRVRNPTEIVQNILDFPPVNQEHLVWQTAARAAIIAPRHVLFPCKRGRTTKQKTKTQNFFLTALAGQSSQRRVPPIPGTHGTNADLLWNETENGRFVPGTDPGLSQGRGPFIPGTGPLFVPNTVLPKMFMFIGFVLA